MEIKYYAFIALSFVLGVCSYKAYIGMLAKMKNRKIKRKLNQQAIERMVKTQELVLKYNDYYLQQLNELINI